MKNILKIAATVLPFGGLCLFLVRTKLQTSMRSIIIIRVNLIAILLLLLLLLPKTTFTQSYQELRDTLDAYMEKGMYDDCITLATEKLSASQEWILYEELSLEFAKCKCSIRQSVKNAKEICSNMQALKKRLSLEDEKERNLYRFVESLNADIAHQEDNFHGRIDILKNLIAKIEPYGDDVFNLKGAIARTYDRMSEFGKMSEVLDEMEKEFEALDTKDVKKEKTLLAARILNANGIGDYVLGRKYLERTLNIGLAMDTIDYNYIRNQYNSLGINYFLSGEYSKSATNLEKALEAALKVREEKDVRGLHNNLGLIYAKLNDYDRSNMFYEKSLKFATMRYGENHTAIARTNFNIGVTKHQQGDFEGALEYLFNSLKVRSELLGPKHSDVAHAQQIIGNTYLKMGEYEKAISFLNKCLPVFIKKYNGEHQEVAWSNNVLAKCYLAMDKYPEAREAVNRSYTGAGYNPINAPTAFGELDVPYLVFTPLKTDMDISISQFKASKDLSRLEDIEEKEIIFYELLSFLTRTSDAAMHRVYAPSVKMIKETLIQKNFLKYEATGDKEILAEIFNLMEKSTNTFLTESKVDKELLSFAGVPKSLLLEQASVNDSIAELQFAISKMDSGTEAYVQTQKQISDYQDQNQGILEQLEKEFPNYYQLKYEHAVCTLEELQSTIKEDEHWLNYFWGQENIYLLSSKASGSEVFQLSDIDEIDKNLDAFYTAILDRSVENIMNEKAVNLYKQLIAPTNPAPGDKLNFVLDDKLSSVPFEILKSDSGEFLLETNPIQYYLSSTLALDPFKGTKKANGAMILSPHFKGEDELEKKYALSLENEVLRSELSTLKGAAKEAEKIHDLLGGRALTADKAKESNFKKNAHKYSILHLATHGLMDEQKPNFSKLAFAQDEEGEDGFLHAYEIYGMSLNADLVTLSACNTGSGQSMAGEGIASLGRAFAYAGCPNSVMSLWNVNDQSTAELMSLFYKNIKEGSNKADALRAAKLEFLKTQPKAFQSPFYWAGFVYYGDNLPLEISSQSLASKGLLFGLLGLGLLLLLYVIRRKK